MDFRNIAKILELDTNKNNFVSLSEIEKQYRNLLEIYDPDLYVNDPVKYKWAQEKIRTIKKEVEFVRNNYEDIKMKYENSTAMRKVEKGEETEKSTTIRKVQKNEERRIQEQVAKEQFFEFIEKIKSDEEKKTEYEEKAKIEEKIEKEVDNRNKKYKWLIILLIILCLIGLSVYLYGNRNATEYDKARGIKEVGKYKNFKKDGLWTIYYENGSYEERYYKDGILEKEITRYNSTGASIQKVAIIDGKKEGKCLEYDLNGNLISECFYVDDKLEGTFRRISKGRVFLEENYKNGILDGKFTLSSNEGRIIVEGFYKDGKKDGEWIYNNLENLYKEESFIYSDLDEYQFITSLIESAKIFDFYNDDQTLNIKGNFKNGLKDGEWQFYCFRNSDDIKKEEKIIQYKDGNFVEVKYTNKLWVNDDGIEESYETFIENNKLKERRYYNGYLYTEGDSFENESGKMTTFSISGKKFNIVEWEKSKENSNILLGKSKIYYESGKLFGEGGVKDYGDFIFFFNNKWKYYNQKGDLILEGNYNSNYEERENGVWKGSWTRKDEWKYYDEIGNILAKGYYSDDKYKLDSYWEFFDKDGNLEKRIEINGNKNEMIEYTIKYYEYGDLINQEKLLCDRSYKDDTIPYVKDLLVIYIDSGKIKFLDENDIRDCL